MAKGDINVSPAQAQFEQAAQQQALRSYNTWLPVQQYFVNKLQTERPGMREMEKGQVAGEARAEGGAALQQGLGRASATGAGPGSGRFLSASQGVTDATGAAVGKGLAGATSDAERRYVEGIQTAISMGQQDRARALQGLGQAAQEQQRYEEQRSTFFNAGMEGLGSIVGGGIGQAAGSMGGGMGGMGGMGGGGGG